MGYPDTQKGYVLYNLTNHTFFVNRDVIFKEDIFPFQLIKKEEVLILTYT